jgi:hypothetical protein
MKFFIKYTSKGSEVTDKKTAVGKIERRPYFEKISYTGMTKIASGTPDEKMMKRSNGPLNGIRRRESAYAAKTPATDAIAVEITANTTLFHSEWRRLPVSTCLKLMSEKWGHSTPHDAFLSNDARKSHSIGARNSTPRPPRIRFSVALRTFVRCVERFSGGSIGESAAAVAGGLLTFVTIISLIVASR